MLPRHAACLVRVCTLLALVLPVLPGHVLAAPPAQGTGGPVTVYHELTQRPEGSLPIESPVLSGDGQRAIWAESPADPKLSNRVFALDVDSGQPREIDAYQPLCACRIWVDVSDDGNSVVSTDGVRIRRLSGGASLSRKNELIRLTDDVIGALRISGDGKLVVFMVMRDTTISEPNPRKRGTPIPRGVWAMSADGGAPKQLAGIAEVALASGVLEVDPDFHAAGASYGLDVSDDGRRVVFGARAGKAAEGVFILGEGLPLTRLFGPVQRVSRVAVSGDGQTVAFMAGTEGRWIVSVIVGGTLKSLPRHGMVLMDRLQLSRDGATLLTGDDGGDPVLVEVATLATRALIPNLTFASEQKVRLFTPGWSFATMNAAGTRVLYVTDVTEPYGPHKANLAVIELGATERGAAPLIRGVRVSPATIPLDGSQTAKVSTELSWEGTLVGVWLEIRVLGVLDPSVGAGQVPGQVRMTDTVGDDPRRLQGAFATDLAHRQDGEIVRDPRLAPLRNVRGPRQLRLIIESQAEDGRRHGTVLDVDQSLMVGDAAPTGTLYRGDAGGRTIETEDFDGTPYRLVVGSFAVEIVLSGDAQAGYTVTGRSLTFDVQKVNANGVQKESYTSSGGTGDLTSFPGGAWGRIGFSGQITLQFESLAPQKHDGWTVDFDLALDNNGQLVMCPDIQEQSDAQAEVSRCLATAIVVMQPVVDQPPPPPPVIT